MKRRHLLLVALSLILSICMCFCLAACDSCSSCGGEPVALATPVVTVDENGVAKWDAVENASGYAYKIGDGEEQATNDTSVTLTDGQSVVVKAVGDGETYADSDWSEAKTYTKPSTQPVKLGKPEVTVNDTGLASWTAVSNATKYVYKINDGAEQETNQTSVQLENGQSIVVKAVGNGTTYTDGDFSDSKTYTAGQQPVDPAQLSAPEVTISADGTASWTAVENATAYEYKINDGTEIETGATSVNLSDGDKIVVRAVGDGTNYKTSGWSEEKTYTAGSQPVEPVKLGTPAVTISNTGLASWAAVPNATKYTVKVGDVETDQTELSKQLENGQTIQVKAVGDGANYTTGDYSTVQTYTAGDTPAPIELMTHAQFVAAADDADVKITGVVTGIAGKNVYLQDDDGGYYIYNSTIPEGLAIGKTIVATGKKDTYNGLHQVASATIEITDAAATTISAVDITDVFTAAADMNDATLVGKQSTLVTIKGVTLGTNDGDNFTFTLGGKSAVLRIYKTQCIDTDAQNALKALFAANEGKTADITGFASTYNGFQLVPAGANTLDIKGAVTLGVPVVSVDANGLASWGEVANATKYVYKINNGTEVEVATTAPRSVQLTNGQSIVVKAVGDGTDYTDSEFSESKTYTESSSVVPSTRGVTFDFTTTIETASSTAYSTSTATEMFKSACGNSTAFTAVTATDKVYPEPVSDVGAIKFSTSSKTGTVTLTFTKDIKKVIIYCVVYGSDAGKNPTLTVNGGTAQSVPATAGDLTFEFTAATNTVKIDAEKRCYIYRIAAFYASAPLAAPSVSVDDNGVVTIGTVENATSIKYKINDGEEKTLGSDPVTLTNGQTIKVWAEGDGENYLNSAEASATYTQTTLSAPVVSVDNGGLATWDADENATGYAYQIKTGDGEWSQDQTATGTSVQLTDGQSIQVKAIGGGRYITSGFSEVKSYVRTALAAPVVKTTASGIEWKAVPNASGYAYKVGDGEYVDVASGALSVSLMDVQGADAGISVVVKAIGLGLYKDSTDSAPVTYKIPDEPQPISLTVEIARDGSVTLKGAKAATFKYTITGAEEQTVAKNGSSVTLKTKLTHEQSITVVAIPDPNDPDIALLLQSLPVTKTYKAPQNTFGSPQNVTFAIVDVDNVKMLRISWDATTEAAEDKVNYEIRYTTPTPEDSGSKIARTNTADIALKQYTKIEIRIRNNDFTLVDDGDYSERYNTGEFYDFTEGFNAVINPYNAANEAKIADVKSALDGLITSPVTGSVDPIQLPAQGADANADVAIAWEVTEGTAATVNKEAGTLEIDATANATVKVTATLTCGLSSDTREFVIEIKKPQTTTSTLIYNGKSNGNLSNKTADINDNTQQLSLDTELFEVSATILKNSTNVAVRTDNNGTVRLHKGNANSMTVTIDGDSTIYKIAIELTTGSFSNLQVLVNNSAVSAIDATATIQEFNINANSFTLTTTAASNAAVDIHEIVITHTAPYYPPAEAVSNTKTDLKLPTPEIDDTTYSYTLPLTSRYGTTISWEFTGLDLDNLDDWDDTDGTLIISRRSTQSTFTAKATITSTEDPTVDDTKDLPIVVDPKVLPKLGTPTVSVDNSTGVVTWDAVDNAVGYVCKIDGEDQQQTTALTVTLTDGQKIQVKAVGDHETYADSDFSAEKTYTAGGTTPEETTLATLDFSSWSNFSSIDSSSGYSGTWSATSKADASQWSITAFNNNNKNASWTYIRAGSRSAATTASISTTVAGKVSAIEITVDKVSLANTDTVKLIVLNGNNEITAIDITNQFKAEKVPVTIPEQYQGNNYTYKLELNLAKTSSNGTIQISKFVCNGYAA